MGSARDEGGCDGMFRRTTGPELPEMESQNSCSSAGKHLEKSPHLPVALPYLALFWNPGPEAAVSGCGSSGVQSSPLSLCCP